MKRFHSKMWHLKLSLICFFGLFLKKIILYHFIENWFLFIFDNCIHIVLVNW